MSKIKLKLAKTERSENKIVSALFKPLNHKFMKSKVYFSVLIVVFTSCLLFINAENSNSASLFLGEEVGGAKQGATSSSTNVCYGNKSEFEILDAPTLFEVTFKVDMTDASSFNPETDNVYISGNFVGWLQPGTDTTLRFEPTIENPMIYTLSVNEIPEGNIQYKYFRVINNRPSWNWDEWSGPPLREVLISNDVMINDIWGIIIPPEEELIADYESNETMLFPIEIIGSGVWNYQSADLSCMLTNNPDPNGINTSSTVMKFLRRGLDEGGEPHAGFVAYKTLNVSDYDYLHVMVWKPRITELKITLRGDYSYTYDAFNQNPQLNSNTWEDIVFDLKDFENELPVFEFMPDFEDPLTANELTEIYFDNVRLSNDSMPYVISINNFAASETSFCENTLNIYISDTNNVNYDSVMWQFEGGYPSVSYELFPEIEYTTSGIFDVILTSWFDSLSNVVTKKDYIEVIAIPEAPLKPLGSEMVCYSELTSEYYTNSGLLIWELTPIEAGEINQHDSICEIIWDKDFSGQVSLRAMAYNICGNGEYSEPLLIQKLASSGVDFIANQTLLVYQPYTVLFTNLTPDSEKYYFFWDFGNGNNSTDFQPEYTYPINSEYTVSLYAIDKITACVETVIKEDYVFCSGVGILNSQPEGTHYYFDYSNRTFNIELQNTAKGSELEVYNLLGECFFSEIVSELTKQISMQDFPNGMYLFVLKEKQKCTSGKFLIIK